MALTVVLAIANPPVVDDAQAFVVATVTNAGASAVTLQSLAVSADKPSVQVSQPNFQLPNLPPSLSNPVLAAGASLAVPFSFVAFSPYNYGSSPNNAPGGAGPSQSAYPNNTNCTVTAIAVASDNSIGSAQVSFSVLSALPPFPRPEGGALILTQGNNAASLLALGAL